MENKTKLIVLGLLILLTVGGILYFETGETPFQDIYKDQNAYKTPPINSGKEIGPAQGKSGPDSKEATPHFRQSAEYARMNAALSEKDKTATPPANYPRHVEEIKKRIYDRNIESIDQIQLLDDLVQTGDKDTREFWGDGWTSVDDWKADSNGFKLEKTDDGALVFTPDRATAAKYTFFQNPQAYTYDEENREFVNEVDYYGKTIYNVAKFINDDVLVMMTISGTKVDLNIYQKNAGQEAADLN